MWNNLLYAEFKGPRHWVLTKPLSYETDNFLLNTKQWEKIGIPVTKPGSIRHRKISIVVPVGYNTDLASIARPIWGIISPWDVARGAVIHDMLYGAIRNAKDTLTKEEIKQLRAEADEIFRRGMNDAEPNIPDWKIKACYYSVRAIGWASIIKKAKFKN
mgnify:CR=1 FL=1|jgi:hypothetical protein|tara:strand:- start:4700 stop:5176 length:477 start_codon:yes stop_codon:yes gene_type:complete